MRVRTAAAPVTRSAYASRDAQRRGAHGQRRDGGVRQSLHAADRRYAAAPGPDAQRLAAPRCRAAAACCDDDVVDHACAAPAAICRRSSISARRQAAARGRRVERSQARAVTPRDDRFDDAGEAYARTPRWRRTRRP